MTRKALIVGGGIAGLSAAIALRKAGFAVEVHEQAPSIEPVGTALSVWGNAMAGLDWLGCGDRLREVASPIQTVSLSNRHDRVLFGPVDVSLTDSFLAMRSDLQHVLLDTLGSEYCRLESRLTREDILQVDADLVVVADGIRSELGQELCGNAIYDAGYAGALGVSEPMAEPVRPGLGIEIWGKGERFGLFDAGGGRCYWFYMESRRSGEASPLAHSDILDKARGWSAGVARAIAATRPDRLHCLQIMARKQPRKLGKGKVICIGDAAHAMEPNQGQGGCQGIEDAWALGVLANSYVSEQILPEFERVRLRRVRNVIRDSMLVGRAVHSPHRWERQMVQKVFSLIPARLDRVQLLGRLRPVSYN